LARPFILYAKVSEKNHLILYAHIIAAITILISGKILLMNYGGKGAALAVVLSYIAFTLVIITENLYLKRKNV